MSAAIGTYLMLGGVLVAAVGFMFTEDAAFMAPLLIGLGLMIVSAIERLERAVRETRRS